MRVLIGRDGSNLVVFIEPELKEDPNTIKLRPKEEENEEDEETLRKLLAEEEIQDEPLKESTSSIESNPPIEEEETIEVENEEVEEGELGEFETRSESEEKSPPEPKVFLISLQSYLNERFVGDNPSFSAFLHQSESNPITKERLEEVKWKVRMSYNRVSSKVDILLRRDQLLKPYTKLSLILPKGLTIEEKTLALTGVSKATKIGSLERGVPVLILR
jgi:hypothetical protein